ncbi:methyl-accepting chemotaxis protein [Pilimelia anulata]|uniref:methyl-accepting chemotaxis protein n=1 Tax=Pilimelia anulata TaxID=53371 RepID=UPI001E5FC2B1|nr:methyl-accepting chemotaxis protein [Pilimelia anulata]
MARQWTFGRRIGVGFAAMVGLTVIVGAMAILAVNVVRSDKDGVIDGAVSRVVNVERLRAISGNQAAQTRGYLLTGDEQSIVRAQQASTEFADQLARLRSSAGISATERGMLDGIEQAMTDYRVGLDRVVAQRRAGVPLDRIGRAFEAEMLPRRVELENRIALLRTQLDRQLVTDRRAADRAAERALLWLLVVVLVTSAVGAVLALYLSRMLSRQIGGVVGHIQSSSAELEAVAVQQANGAREQATAMNEITTTTNELTITSRQIVDTAQRVSRTAEQTAEAARTGDATIDQTRESMIAIRRQVDLIVGHMLELGEKSQQIGVIVELVSELAEQTNILAINATIEASGAGEWGRRFAVVADEIRKLADRTAGSAKEIRALVDDVRGAVNTTVMATETGAKAVDSGAQRFDEVTAAFNRISGMVATTTDAAREIELSTRQQSTAVEQTNVAVGDTARVTQETEVSSTQTRQTASQLAGLAGELMRLVSTKGGG